MSLSELERASIDANPELLGDTFSVKLAPSETQADISIVMRRVHSCWAEIDLDAIENNVRYALECVKGSKLMAVVKALGYGHGAIELAEAAVRGGASWLAVARANEALELRRAGLDAPLLILAFCPSAMVPTMIRNKVSLAVVSLALIRQVNNASAAAGLVANVHLKVDTGMSRFGVQLSEFDEALALIESSEHLRLEGLFTHFAKADEPSSDATDRQYERFRSVCDKISDERRASLLVHCCNSAATMLHSSKANDMVRFGISLYGLHPDKEFPFPAQLQPVMSFKTQVAQVKELEAGRGVGYGLTWVTSKPLTRVATLPVGYADGYRRTGGHIVLVNGQRAPVVGRVCMDAIVIDTSDVDGDVRVGDEVVLMGRQGDELLSTLEVANLCETITYEVTCNIGARVPRVFFRRTQPSA